MFRNSEEISKRVSFKINKKYMSKSNLLTKFMREQDHKIHRVELITPSLKTVLETYKQTHVSRNIGSLRKVIRRTPHNKDGGIMMPNVHIFQVKNNSIK